MITDWTAFIAAVGTVSTPVVTIAGWLLNAYMERRALRTACAACTEKLRALAKGKPPTAILSVAFICYGLSLALLPGARQGMQATTQQIRSRALEVVTQPKSETPPPAATAEGNEEAKDCGDDCTKKSNCRCVSDQCRCGAVDVAPAPLTPAPAPQKPPAPRKKRRPVSAIARALPQMAGDLQPGWFANLPPSTGPIGPQL